MKRDFIEVAEGHMENARVCQDAKIIHEVAFAVDAIIAHFRNEEKPAPKASPMIRFVVPDGPCSQMMLMLNEHVSKQLLAQAKDKDQLLVVAMTDRLLKMQSVLNKLGSWASAAQDEDSGCCPELKAIFNEVLELADPEQAYADRDFCTTCGAGIPPIIREGTCPKCDRWAVPSMVRNSPEKKAEVCRSRRSSRPRGSNPARGSSHHDGLHDFASECLPILRAGEEWHRALARKLAAVLPPQRILRHEDSPVLVWRLTCRGRVHPGEGAPAQTLRQLQALRASQRRQQLFESLRLLRVPRHLRLGTTAIRLLGGKRHSRSSDARSSVGDSGSTSPPSCQCSYYGGTHRLSI